jgi:hypothetical protein
VQRRNAVERLVPDLLVVANAGTSERSGSISEEVQEVPLFLERWRGGSLGETGEEVL